MTTQYDLCPLTLYIHIISLSNGLEGSHAWEHVREYHPEMVDVDNEGLLRVMEWEVVKVCKSAFERGVSEAIFIQLGFDSNDITMNSREEWGSYDLPELTLKERQSRREKLERDMKECTKGEGDLELGEELEDEQGRGRGKRGAQPLASSLRSKRRRKMRGGTLNDLKTPGGRGKRKKENLSPEQIGAPARKLQTLAQNTQFNPTAQQHDEFVASSLDEKIDWDIMTAKKLCTEPEVEGTTVELLGNAEKLCTEVDVDETTEELLGNVIGDMTTAKELSTEVSTANELSTELVDHPRLNRQTKRPMSTSQPRLHKHTTGPATDWLSKLRESRRDRSMSLTDCEGGNRTRPKVRTKSVCDRPDGVSNSKTNRQLSVKDLLRAMSSRAKPPTRPHSGE